MKNKNKFIKLPILVLLAAVVASSGFQCKFVTPQQQQLLEPIELTWWGVYDDPDSFQEIINDYKAVHPNVTITYKKLRPEEFETQLLNSLAEDRGPDIFSIHNDWVTKYLSKIEPLPAKTTMAYQVTRMSLGIKQETIFEVRDTTSITPAQLKNAYVDAVYYDAVRDGKIYGLPLSVDSLALFYNRDLLNNSAIPLPPNDWVTLQADVKKLTFQDKGGKLVQAGIAMGTADNVDRASDIVSLLMMQNGAQMSVGKQVTFGSIPSGVTDRNYVPGPEAVRFYTDFANSAKEVYTWSKDFPNSVDAFAAGQVAMMFGYNYHIPYLESKRQGKLNYGITSVPQINGRPPVNFANYWVQSVSKKSKHVNEAWDFIQFMSKPEEAKKYLAKTAKPTALRTLVADQSSNDNLKVFADQLLTAKSWYQGNNANAMENAFKDMLKSVNDGTEVQQAVNLASLKIQQTL
ncbi:MAG: extracellular solute-binding protein [Patescibacteria group bacterium]|nr:extracellular solute-binding protein [Patescibacteria group bacterium]